MEWITSDLHFNHGRSLDVGFDAHGKILSLKEAVERVKNKPIIPPLYLTK